MAYHLLKVNLEDIPPRGRTTGRASCLEDGLVDQLRDFVAYNRVAAQVTNDAGYSATDVRNRAAAMVRHAGIGDKVAVVMRSGGVYIVSREALKEARI